MASVIRIKRSEVNGNPASLCAGELAYSGTDNSTGYYVTFTLNSGSSLDVDTFKTNLSVDFDTTWASGLDSDNVIQIYEITELQQIEDEDVVGSLGLYYELANNINASCTSASDWDSTNDVFETNTGNGYGFDPIGDSTTKFSGTFDGKFNTVRQGSQRFTQHHN